MDTSIKISDQAHFRGQESKLRNFVSERYLSSASVENEICVWIGEIEIVDEIDELMNLLVVILEELEEASVGAVRSGAQLQIQQ